MAQKIRILSYHYIQNNGAFLFAYALLGLLKNALPEAEVKIMDYKPLRLSLYEYLKRYQLLPGLPQFYLKRARLWKSVLAKHLDLDTSIPRFSSQAHLLSFFSKRYDALIVGMDVWCVVNHTARAAFPNIYWLPGELTIPKIAYGVSAYYSDIALLQRYSKQITGYLNDFSVIGARDRFTHRMVMEKRTRPEGLVERIPDPTFLHEFSAVGTAEKLVSLGVDFSRPLVGLMLYGDDELAKDICAHYRSKGCQVLAMSMYNRNADINLGHLLTPFEWAETFRFLSFCFSDRYHGAVFCLKSGIPFISLEKDRRLPISQSKIYDLLLDFDLRRCYLNPQEAGFDTARMLKLADELLKNWEIAFKPGVESTIEAMKERQDPFIQQMKAHIFRSARH